MPEQLKEDIEQYQEMLELYEGLQQTDIDEAYEYSKTFLIMADRWNEIMLESAKYCTLMGISRTLFEKWTYHKYRVLMTAHEFCRVVYRQGKESLKNGFYNEIDSPR